MIDRTASRIKAVLHGFFLSITTTIAEPSIILPLIVNYFSGSSLVVGIFSSLLKGGAILVQLFAAFGAQSYPKVMPHLRFVFAARFTAWFLIGLCIYLFGEKHPTLTLWCIGAGLFVFSFSAGFGAIYFNELLGKVFSHRYRGRVFAQRQFMAGVGAVISGFAAGVILETFEAPLSFAYLFMVSALMMGFGVVAFALIEEPEKRNVSVKEERFRTFIRNALGLLRSDAQLRRQIRTYLFAYAHLFSLPFIILDAEAKLGIGGMQVGYLLTIQIVGGMLSNLVWGRMAASGAIRPIIYSAFAGFIAANALALFAGSLWHYGVLFFFIGAAIDGMRLAFSNNILVIAPEEKRPVYIALQSNLTSFGLFFSIPGALILQAFGYGALYFFTISLLFAGLFSARGLK
jgi:MFS family permease